MVKKIIKFLSIIVMMSYSCSSDSIIEDEFIEEDISPNKIDLKINGQPPIHSIRNLTTSLCCDKELFVSFNHWIVLEDGREYGGYAFRLSLDKKGNLLTLWYKDYVEPNNEFYSANFVPIKTLNVENFEFVENEYLKVKVSGILFKQTYNFFQDPETTEIDFDLEIREFISCSCNYFPSHINLNNDFIFYTISWSRQGNDIKYRGYTNNGYQIEFNNFTESLKDMPLGITYFDEDTTTKRIDFRKFIGVPRQFYHDIVDEEWIKYKTSGSFEILDRYEINGSTVSKLKFNLTAKENGEVVYEFNDAIFETQQ